MNTFSRGGGRRRRRRKGRGSYISAAGGTPDTYPRVAPGGVPSDPSSQPPRPNRRARRHRPLPARRHIGCTALCPPHTLLALAAPRRGPARCARLGRCSHRELPLSPTRVPREARPHKPCQTAEPSDLQVTAATAACAAAPAKLSPLSLSGPARHCGPVSLAAHPHVRGCQHRKNLSAARPKHRAYHDVLCYICRALSRSGPGPLAGTAVSS